MKNAQLKKEMKDILANPKAVITKGEISGNSIDISVQEPFEDLGSFVYYDRADERDADFEELQSLVKEKNEC